MLDSQMSTVTPTTKLPVENPLAPLMLALDSGPIPGRVLAASQFLRAALTISYSLGSLPPLPRSCGSGTLSATPVVVVLWIFLGAVKTSLLPILILCIKLCDKDPTDTVLPPAVALALS